MLTNDWATVDAYNVSVGEGLTNDAQGLGIKVGLGIGGHEYGSIDDKIIGISGGQTVVAIIDGAGEWELQQTVGTSVERP